VARTTAVGPYPGLRAVAPAEYRSVRAPVWRSCIVRLLWQEPPTGLTHSAEAIS
jgi:hypothetical protein